MSVLDSSPTLECPGLCQWWLPLQVGFQQQLQGADGTSDHPGWPWPNLCKCFFYIYRNADKICSCFYQSEIRHWCREVDFLVKSIQCFKAVENRQRSCIQTWLSDLMLAVKIEFNI